MDIAQRIANKSKVCEWRSCLDHFRVSQKPAAPTKVLFIGESPHTDEVKSACLPEKRFPLAGKSGERITKRLDDFFSDDQGDLPIGKLVASGSVSWLSIINVAEVPLDPAAYHQLVANGDVHLDLPNASPSIVDWLKLMYSFALIKEGPGRQNRHNCFVSEIECCIVTDFCDRLQNAIGGQTKLVVLLGKVAQEYYRKCKLKHSVEALCAPHPSPRSNGTDWNIADDLGTRLRRYAN